MNHEKKANKRRDYSTFQSRHPNHETSTSPKYSTSTVVLEDIDSVDSIHIKETSDDTGIGGILVELTDSTLAGSFLDYTGQTAHSPTPAGG